MRKKLQLISVYPIATTLEPSERHILESYIRIIRRSRPLTETRKIQLFHRLNAAKARRRLIQHYLPLVLELASLDKKGDLARKIQVGNQALIEWLRKGDCRPLDDVDYMIRHRVMDALKVLR